MPGRGLPLTGRGGASGVQAVRVLAATSSR